MGTAWNEAPLMCCCGDGRCSGQESGGDIKAWCAVSRPLSWVLLSLCCAVCKANCTCWSRGAEGAGQLLSTEALEPSCLGSAAEPTSWIQTPAPRDLEQALFGHQTDRAPSVPRSRADVDCSRGGWHNDEASISEPPCSKSSSACDSLCKPGEVT